MSTTLATPRPPQPDESAPLPASPAPLTPAPAGGGSGVERALLAVAVVGAPVLSVIGLGGSYRTLQHLAAAEGFGRFAYVFPIGVDVGIVVLLALDLVLTRLRAPLPLLRWGAYLLTVSTVYFNASAGHTRLAAAMHGVLPVLWILVVEAARRYVARTAAIEAGRPDRSVPLSRWLLAPVSTWRMWRRMVLWDLPSYAAGVAAYRAHVVYRQLLAQDHGRKWRRDATADALLPVTLAPYGVGVDEALLIPAQRQQDAARRVLEAELRADQDQAERDRIAHAARLRRLASGAELRTAETEAEAQVAAADLASAEGRAEAERRRRLADARADAEAGEIAAQAAAQQLLTAAEADSAAQLVSAEAEARRLAAAERAAADERAAAAKQRLEAAEAEEAAAEAERVAAEARRLAAEAERLAAGDEVATAAARVQQREAEQREAEAEAEAARVKAEGEEAVAEAGRRASEARLRAAEVAEAAAAAELRAAEADAAAKLPPSERQARALARRLATRQSGSEISLQEIQDLYGISQTTASVRLARARELITSQIGGDSESGEQKILPQVSHR